MSREMPMMITRIQYWNTPFSAEKRIRSPANFRMIPKLSPEVNVSTPLRITSGSTAPNTSLSTRAPMPKARPRRYRRTYGHIVRRFATTESLRFTSPPSQ